MASGQGSAWTQAMLPSGGVPIPSKSGRPWVSFSNSPGGTLYGVTPGGTRIKYQRNELLKLRDSPLAKKMKDLPEIPGITLDSAAVGAVSFKDDSGSAEADKAKDDEEEVSQSDPDASPKQKLKVSLKDRSLSKEDVFQMDSD